MTTFSEDGLLSQVESGMETSLRGSATIAAILEDTEKDTNKATADDDDRIIVIIASLSSFGKIHRLDHHPWFVTTGLSGDASLLANAFTKHCQNYLLAFWVAPSVR
mmetsp:Transcript_28010/g.68193  ORF Transcript_28010/g.68193 Transcript_28010/m.68193 type:complete len:106 (-) Transcript_28010:1043-1360(-)